MSAPQTSLPFSGRPMGSFAVAVLAFLVACVGGPRADAVTIIPIFDSTITSGPDAANVEATIKSCIAEYDGALVDPTVVTVTFIEQTNGLGASGYGPVPVSYSGYRSALVSHATTSEDNEAVSSLPNTVNNPVNSAGVVRMQPALALTMGLSTNAAGDVIYLNTSICNVNPQTDNNPDNYSLFAVICHEMDEVLGAGGAGSYLDGTNGTPAPTDAVGPTDLFRYSFPGGVSTRSFNTIASTVCYLSINGTTNTVLAQFNQNAGGDFGDFVTGSTPLVQDAFGTPGAQPTMSVEWNMLDVVGYNWTGYKNIWCSATSMSGTGTVYSPATFSAAVAAANLVGGAGGILMTAGTYNHTGLLSTKCRLRAVNGTARIQ